MAAVGGPIESIIINKRRFTSDGEDVGNLTLSGYENEVKPNGDGSMRLVKKPVIGKIEGLNLSIDNDTGDFEFLNETQKMLVFVPVQVSLVDGTVYNGSMQITDAVKLDTKESTCEVSLNGTLEKL